MRDAFIMSCCYCATHLITSVFSLASLRALTRERTVEYRRKYDLPGFVNGANRGSNHVKLPMLNGFVTLANTGSNHGKLPAV